MVSILLDESLASTNPAESLYIAQNIVRLLRRLRARTMFATHLHELAAAVAVLHGSTAGDSLIVSLVASRMGVGEDGPRRSYKIAAGSQLCFSHSERPLQHLGQILATQQLAQFGHFFPHLRFLLSFLLALLRRSWNPLQENIREV
jgi:hypothetical protein